MKARVRSKVPAELQASVTSAIEHRFSKPEGALVSVIVPAYNVAEYLPAFLTSITAQSYRNLEIIVVNDGSPDDSAQIARRRAKIDPRIRVIDRENGGLGAARNTGLSEANGKYIVFADSDDKLPKNAIYTMVSTLEQTGSDFVVGSLMRLKGNRKWMPKWVRSVHERDRLKIQIADYPEVIHNVFACTKLWRLDFFKRVVQEFPVGIVHEDLEPSLKAYFGAHSFDLITDPVYFWRSRDDRSSISQQKASMRNLRDRLSVTLQCADRVLNQTDKNVRSAWCKKVFTVDILQFIEEVPRTGPEYFETLSRGVRRLLRDLDETDLHAVPIYPRLAALYVARGDQDGLIDVISGRYQHGTGYRLSVEDGDLCAIPSYAEALPQPPENRFFKIYPDSLNLETHLSSIRWLDGSRVEITGTAYVLSAFPDSETEPIVVELEQINTGDRIPLDCERRWIADANEHSDTEWRDCRTSGFKAVIETSDIPLGCVEETDNAWRIKISTSVGDHRVSDVIHSRSENASAGVLGFSEFVGGRRAALSFDDYHGLIITKPKPKSVALEQHLQGRHVRLIMQADTDARIVRLRVTNRQSLQRIMVKPVPNVDAACTVFEFELPDLTNKAKIPGRKTWDVEVQFDDNTTGKIAASGSIQDYIQEASRQWSLSWQVSDKGYISIAEYPFLFTCDGLSVEDASRKLVVTGSLYSTSYDLLPEIVLGNNTNKLHAVTVDWDPATMRYQAEFLLEQINWDQETVGLPTGRYYIDRLVAQGSSENRNDAQRAVLVDAAAHILPWRGCTDLNSLIATRSQIGRHLQIYVGVPIATDDRGILAQNRVRSKAISENSSEGLLNAVVFESYHGRNVSDSVLAISKALAEERPHIRQYWSVSSNYVTAPHGTNKIVQGTPEWFEVAHRAKYLINNANFPSGFRKQAGQLYLQTWHGSPMKKIGEDMPPGSLSLNYRLMMRREARYWDMLLSQSPHSTKILPAALGYDGPVAELGYPRNDVMRSSNLYSLRQEIRQKVGVPNTANVVLYAPTFRDTQKSRGGFTFADMLNLEALPDLVGSNTYILVRAHSNIGNLDLSSYSSRIIDVSLYNDISELFVIADVLVTDYSSMLFDFVVTGKPIVFYTPDIDEYGTSVRGFYLDFAEVCPGPLCETTDGAAKMINRAVERPELFDDEKYRWFVETYAPYDDGQATDRVLSHLIGQGWFV